MLRRLLACLALLTGLAAAGAPAQAEVAASLASRVEASAGRHIEVQRQADSLVLEAAQYPDCIKADAGPTLDTDIGPASTVRIGSDRARE